MYIKFALASILHTAGETVASKIFFTRNAFSQEPCFCWGRHCCYGGGEVGKKQAEDVEGVLAPGSMAGVLADKMSVELAKVWKIDLAI